MYNLIGRPSKISGNNLDDLKSCGSRYSSENSWSDTFYVKITDTFNIDKWVWAKNTVTNWSETLIVSNDSVLLDNGVYVRWDSLTGHSLNDMWVIYCYDIADCAAEKTPRWEYWMFYSYSDRCTGLGLEETIVEASHDGFIWEIPYFVCTDGSTHDSVFAPGFFNRGDIHRGQALIYRDSIRQGNHISDPEGLLGLDGNMYALTRIRKPGPRFEPDTVMIVGISSPDGVVWYPSGRAEDAIHTLIKDVVVSYMSPTMIIDTGDTYTMWYCEGDGNDTGLCVMRRTADHPFGPWSREDTCRWICAPHRLKQMREPWHINMIKYKDSYHSIAVESDTGRSGHGRGGIYLSTSSDGLNWRTIPQPLVEPNPEWGTWDHYFVYRASAVPAVFGNNVEGYKIWYSAHDGGRQACYAIGYTEAYLDIKLK